MSIEIGVLCAVFGLAISFAAFLRARRTDGADEGKRSADIEYIRRRTDDILLEQRNTNITLQSHAERITRVEESAKQAHKRINALEERRNIVENNEKQSV